MTFKLIINPKTEKTLLDLSRMPQEVERGIRRGAYLVGKALVKDSVADINKKPKTGNEYIIYEGIGGKKLNRPRRHTASAPLKESPAVITGKLRKTINFKVRGAKRLEFGAGSSEVDYAKDLETGGGRVKPRFYLKRSINRTRGLTKRTLGREVNKLIKE